LPVKTKLIVNVTRHRCVCVGELADGPLSRMRGLLGRSGLPAGEGLLLIRAPAIHTAFMRFSIDALFLDDELRVLEIVEAMRPWHVASSRRARSVLELAAGESARRGIRVGDRLALRDRKPVDERTAMAARVAGAPADKRDEPVIWRKSSGEPEAPVRLQPLRVLVVSEDAHFRSVTSMLLTHRGCSVTTSAKAARAAELVNADGADVVLIDAGKAPGTVQTVAEVRALARPVGVVVVDESVTSESGSPVLAKWGPFESLYAAIERADRSRNGHGFSA
jgi:uncharacterized membrane protein (UPF0127 family)/CheY-like chemotaxis protein